ncbi:MAG: hypothetical protein ACUVSQ_04500 [Pseudanabaenaceae cyanobacterium]
MLKMGCPTGGLTTVCRYWPKVLGVMAAGLTWMALPVQSTPVPGAEPIRAGTVGEPAEKPAEETGEVPADVLRVAQEAIEPVPVNGSTVSIPVVMQKDAVQRAAVTLILRARKLLEAPETRPTIGEINRDLGAYNDLIVRLGLTESAQLAHFPRIQAIGSALAEIRAQNVQP